MPRTPRKSEYCHGGRTGGGHNTHPTPAIKSMDDPNRYRVRMVSIEGRWIQVVRLDGEYEWMWSAMASWTKERVEAQWGDIAGMPAWRSERWKMLLVEVGHCAVQPTMVADEPAYCFDCPPRWLAADRAVREATPPTAPTPGDPAG